MIRGIRNAFAPGPRERTARRRKISTSPRQGSGSGFIIDRDGFILTNHHVIEAAERIGVTLADGRAFRAKWSAPIRRSTWRCCKIAGSHDLPEAPLGNSDELRVGEWVCAIGNPLGYVHSVTVGVVSFIGRKLFDPSLDDYIQTDAAINFGNSGGPLINSRGEVIGINSAISSRASNIGFAVPINQAVGILPQLKTAGQVSRGYMGVLADRRDPGAAAFAHTRGLARRAGAGRQCRVAGRTCRAPRLRRHSRCRRPRRGHQRGADSEHLGAPAGYRRASGGPPRCASFHAAGQARGAAAARRRRYAGAG